MPPRRKVLIRIRAKLLLKIHNMFMGVVRCFVLIVSG